MLRQTIESLRLLAAFLREIPPFAPRLLVPGALALGLYPLLAVAFGPDAGGRAFVTAFLCGLALRIGLRFGAMAHRLLERFSRQETALTALVAGLGPLVAVMAFDDPLWCQRMQSAWFVVLGATFVSDMLAGRTDMAARFWPWPAMAGYLGTLTRAMVLYNLGFLFLNEAMIVHAAPSGWLVFWAVLPVLSHVALGLMVLTVVHLDDMR